MQRAKKQFWSPWTWGLISIPIKPGLSTTKRFVSAKYICHRKRTVSSAVRSFRDLLQLPTGNNSVFSNSYNKGILALTSASAGTGNFLDDENFEELEIFDQVPKKASFGVYLDGDSMEPGFKNEQLIWIEQTDTLESGDLGLFFLDGLTYFKKFVKKKSGIFLVSLNPKYKPIPVSEYLKEIICTPWEI